jgi:hypothetical protein
MSIQKRPQTAAGPEKTNRKQPLLLVGKSGSHARPSTAPAGLTGEGILQQSIRAHKDAFLQQLENNEAEKVPQAHHAPVDHIAAACARPGQPFATLGGAATLGRVVSAPALVTLEGMSHLAESPGGSRGGSRSSSRCSRRGEVSPGPTHPGAANLPGIFVFSGGSPCRPRESERFHSMSREFHQWNKHMATATHKVRVPTTPLSLGKCEDHWGQGWRYGARPSEWRGRVKGPFTQYHREVRTKLGHHVASRA